MSIGEELVRLVSDGVDSLWNPTSSTIVAECLVGQRVYAEATCVGAIEVGDGIATSHFTGALINRL